ncbi:unnamed protein product [Ixodes hexagonus]
MTLSKFLTASLPYNCYEIGHTWTPHCSQAWLDLWFTTFVRSLRLYGLLYFAGQIVSRRFDVHAFVQTLKSTVNSSMFISQNFFLYLIFACVSSRLMGRLRIMPATFLSGFLSAGCAILIERPGRRAMLAVYMLNLTTDILYRMLRSRGIVRDIQHGEVAVFALSLGGYIYYARKHGYFEDVVTFVLRHLFGAEELHGTECRKTKHAGLHVNGDCHANWVENSKGPGCNGTGQVNGTAHVNGSGIIYGLKKTSSKDTSHAKRIVRVNGNMDINANEKCCANEHLATVPSQRGLVVRILDARHLSCQHSSGCLAQFCRRIAKFAPLGWAVGFGVSLLGDLKRLPSRRQPLLTHAFSSSSLRSACFLGGLTGIYRLVSCSLRWASNCQRDWHGLAAGTAAGVAAAAAPNSNVSLYLLWKLIEMVYLKSADEKLVPKFSSAPVFLYSLCTGIMLYAAILEPHNLRPQYLKFLDDICGNLLSKMNRAPLDLLGFHSSSAFPDFFPLNLDPKHVSRGFLQNVLIWS